MNITIIGCWGGFPKAGEATSGYMVEHDGFKLLLECGSGVVSLMQQKYDLGEIDAVILTHYHYDHMCDIGPLQYARQIKTQLGQINKSLPIYAPRGEFFNLLKWEDYAYGQDFDEKSILTIGPFEITFIKNVHPVEAYSIKVKCSGKVFSFTSDTAYFEGLENFFDKSDILISECSFYSHMDGTKAGHLNSSQAGMLAENAHVKKLVLTHLPHFGNLEDLVAQAKEQYSGEIVLAEKFMELKI
ncbi:MBL fold metallo-hydrolase [Sedimentibacter sp. B4]|uniref:MBL fold metallo-hydrolase n=1 Tax=Sedimentibacter sp. B4 TaxID=304766 RepID=UPI0002DDB9AC|nr:MBL fold metallo-hydrolase [Sedimentibacter sp. B4]